MLVSKHVACNPYWDHLHVLHTCSYQRSSCRCSIRKHYEQAIRHRHTVQTRCSQLQTRNWIRFVQYLSSESRSIGLLVLGDDHWLSPPKIRFVSDGLDTTDFATAKGKIFLTEDSPMKSFFLNAVMSAIEMLKNKNAKS